MTAALLLSLAIATSPLSPAPDAVPADPERGWPAHVDVFRRHARGSSVPARVERVRTTVYVGRVLASGAMSGRRPMAALRAMSLVVGTRVAWLSRHRDPRMRFRGRSFVVTDGSKPQWCQACDHGMYYRAVRVPARIRRAVSDVQGMLLRRPNGNIRKPAWSGPPAKCGAGVTGNRLPAQGAAMCARRGYSWQRIIKVYFPKGTVR